MYLVHQLSYGVTMWEIFSGGKTPYPGIDPLTLVQSLETGKRMLKPNNTACTDEMLVSSVDLVHELLIYIFSYAKMRKCWEKTPQDRPSFKELHTTTSKYIEHIAGYLGMEFNPFAGDEDAVKEEASKCANIMADGDQEDEGVFQFTVIPPSVESNETHSDFTKATD